MTAEKEGGDEQGEGSAEMVTPRRGMQGWYEYSPEKLDERVCVGGNDNAKGEVGRLVAAAAGGVLRVEDEYSSVEGIFLIFTI